MNKKVWVRSLGCKANFSDGLAMESQLLQMGYQLAKSELEADVILVNSCTVTNEADVQSQKAARDAAKKNPHAKVIYTGCGAEVNPLQALKIPGVSAVLGNQNKHQAGALIDQYLGDQYLGYQAQQPMLLGSVSNYKDFRSQHPMDREWSQEFDPDVREGNTGVKSHHYRTRAFLKIQEGCDMFCTYCIIPYGRGTSRSLPIATLVQKVQQLTATGTQEVVLTGTNIGDYGSVQGHPEYTLTDLLKALLNQTDLKRVRVSSLNPAEISSEFISWIDQEERICPHFHVSLQHVDSKILKLMKRKYTREDVVRCLSELSRMKRKPFVGMDYIVGFPGETEEIFEQSLEALKKLYWTRLHVFPYSEREGTPATKLGGKVEVSERKRRAKIMQELSLERLQKTFSWARQQFTEQQGLLKGVLIEGVTKGPDPSKTWVSGYSPEYQRVLVPVEQASAYTNKIIDVPIHSWSIDRAQQDILWLSQGMGST